MLALAVACPAFADDVTATTSHTNGAGYINAYTSNPNATLQTNCDGDTPYPLFFNNTAPGAGTFTLTARYSPIKYTITYKSGDGSGSNVVKYVKYTSTNYCNANGDESSTDPLNALTFNATGFTAPAGYEFDKWDSDHNISNGGAATSSVPVYYTAGATLGSYNVIGNTEMTALWKGKTYPVTYYGGTAKNGSYTHTVSGTVSDTATFDVAYTIKDNTGSTGTGFSQTGYNFNGWLADYNIGDGTAASPALNSDHTSGGVPYSAGDDPTYGVTNDNGVKLYAQWTPKTYTVIYDKGLHAASGVNNHHDTGGATYDAAYTALTGGGDDANDSATGIYAAPGYDFCGWSATQPTEAGAPNNCTNFTGWTGVTQWQEDADKTVYAVYAKIPYSITYECGDGASGTAPTDTNTYTVGQTDVSISATYGTCAKTGSTPSSWTCKKTSDNGIVGQTNNTITMPASNVKCTANYSDVPHTVTYDCGEGSGTVTAAHGNGAEYNYQATVTVLTDQSDCAAPTGKHFSEWTCVGATPDSNHQFLMPATDVVCTAQWDPNIIHLRWKSDDDDASPAETTCNYGSVGGTTGGINGIEQPQKPGYEFVGWEVTHHDN